MNRTIWTLLLGALVMGLVLPGAAVASHGHQIDQDVDADAHTVQENMMNEASVYHSGDDAAFATANCQLMVLADVWVVSIASAEALGVINDEDEFDVSHTVVDTVSVFGADTADADCTQSTGPVEIHVHLADGFGETAPQGSSADILAAFQLSRAASSATIDQEASAGAEADENVMNDMTVNNYGDDSAFATANCQSLIAAHSGVVAAALASANGEINSGDQVTVTLPDDLTPSATRVSSKELANNEKATASCAQPVEKIDIFVGRGTGSGKLPTES